MSKKRLLLTAGGSPSNEAIWRYLSEKYTLFFADMSVERIHPTIPRENCISIPKATEPGFFAEIARICADKNIDLLVPGVDEELVQIASNANSLSHTRVFLPRAEFVEQMLDKYEMYRALKAVGIPVPMTVLASEDTRNIPFPTIVKPRHGRGSRGVMTVAGRGKIEHCVKMLDGDPSDWIVQEKAAGDEYTVQVIGNEGNRAHAIVPVLAHEKRGSTVSAETVFDPEVIAYCKRIHTELSPRGSYNVQLMKSNDGSIKAFEINPRVSTTFCLLFELGLDPFEFFLSHSSVEAGEQHKARIKLVRHWSNEITRA